METLVKWTGVLVLTLFVYMGLHHITNGAVFFNTFTWAFFGGCIAFIAFSGVSVKAG